MFLSLLILISGFFASQKRVTQIQSMPNDWLDEENASLSQNLTRLEDLWKTNVIEAAKNEAMPSHFHRTGDFAREVHGIRQVSLVKNKRITHTITEFPTKTPAPPQPAFSAEKGDFILDREVVFSGAPTKWILHEQHPPLFTMTMSDAHAVLLLLDLETAAHIARDQLHQRLEKLPLTVPPGSLRQIIDNKGNVLFQNGKSTLADQPSDETTHHASIFGTWKIRYWHPRKTITTYHQPLLIGSILLASVIALAGWLVARSQERALRIASERVSFVNSVSHELRTPLTNILLTTDLLSDEIATTSGQNRLGLVREESQRLARMVDNVLTFARAERGPLDPGAREKFSLRPFLENCIRQFDSSFQRKNITTELHTPENDTLHLPPDPISQITLNLLSNIEKYAGENATARITADLAHNTFTLRVADDGPGIPASAKRRIFHSFERLDDLTRTGITGTGLGLSISRELAHALGGDLILEKTQKGASFLLTLPNQKTK